MKQNTATSTAPNHSSLVALLMRLGAKSGEAYNVAEEMATESKRIAVQVAEDAKMQVVSRIEALQVALESLKSEVAARFQAIGRRLDGVDQRLDRVDQRFDGVDQRFDGVDQRLELFEREMRLGLKTIDERLDRMQQHFDRMAVQLDNLYTDYRRLVLLLVLPVALAVLAGIGGMVWQGLRNLAGNLP